jgi:heme-degrading monooxygenase HmoA
MIPKHPLPYYAVIFSSIHHEVDELYHQSLKNTEIEAQKIKGYLGMDSARSEIGISVSYWESMDDIQLWLNNSIHREAKEMGIKKWYESYHVRICKVEKEYDFKRS